MTLLSFFGLDLLTLSFFTNFVTSGKKYLVLTIFFKQYAIEQFAYINFNMFNFS